MRKGIIYKLSFPNNKEYIGQTVQEFQDRLKKHFSAARTCKEGGCVALNSAIRKYGAANVKHEILLICNENQLDYYEQKSIELYNTLSPNGYNLMLGGNSNKTMSDTTKAKMSESAKNRDTSAYRKNPKSFDLPKYLIYFKDDRYEGYKISKHPNCESKYFYDKNKTLEENKIAALEFLRKLNNGELKVEKKVFDLPFGIQKYGRGYRIYYVHPGQSRHIKNFDQKEYSEEENLERAKKYLADFQKKFIAEANEKRETFEMMYEDTLSKILRDVKNYEIRQRLSAEVINNLNEIDDLDD
jgi:hypothetical protein